MLSSCISLTYRCLIVILFVLLGFIKTSANINKVITVDKVETQFLKDTTRCEPTIQQNKNFKIRSSFIFVDNPARLFTMRQFRQNYLGTYLLVANSAYETFKFLPASYFVLGVSTILGMPLTHEEGHRSILTYKNIGSISRPYFNSKGAAYVQGVTDNSLIELRDNDLPNYIRLHTAGLESDYMLAHKIESYMVFSPHNQKLLYIEYLMRKLSLLQYYLTGLFKYDFDLVEETDELKRDIVGHDVYGAVKHIHRPNEEFIRYNQYVDLTKEEKSMIKRIGWRSLFNLASPFLFFKNGFSISQNVKYNLSLGYTMSPFGDFIDQYIWLSIKEQNFMLYFRQHQNKENWFPAAGVGIYDLPLGKRFRTDANIHVWNQPKGLSFTETIGFWGGAFDISLRYLITPNFGERLKRISFDIGILAKTKGFMPEEMEMDKSIGGRFGMSLYYYLEWRLRHMVRI
ncbi:MAG: hypothetical protein PHS05_02565 [Bacteroidales bacterium]|nr:hypothetical protein [Bacteroidales bacterium]